MRRLLMTTALGALLTASTGCFYAGASTAGVPGFLYANTITPAWGTSATSNVAGSKTGQAVCESFMGLIATGDCSVEAAAANGKITRIHSVARKVENMLGIYAKITIIVTGE
jgi:hypothetical protein